MGANQQYTSEMRERFGYSATWFPTVPVRLGDIGRLTGYEYQRVGCLADFGVTFEETNTAGQASLNYVSADAVIVKTKLSGSLPGVGSTLTKADAGIQLSFGSKNATFFQAVGISIRGIANLLELESEIASLASSGAWENDLVLIGEVLHVESATVVISSSANAMVEFRAGAKMRAGPVNLADATAKLQITHSRDIGTQLVAESGLTPLFKAFRLKTRLLRRPTLSQRRAAPVEEGKVSSKGLLSEVDYTDY